jgi:predicted NUDIX family NTP pyrophosphohydrolase
MKRSAGILLFRRIQPETEVLLVHPGGPFWAEKDLGSWSIPKGEYVEGEDVLSAAIREFREETGFDVEGEFVALGDIRQAGGKVVSAWALEKDLDAALIQSNSFELEWAPRSGKRQTFPEVDKASWFRVPEAKGKILGAQVELLDRLAAQLMSLRRCWL